MKDLFERATKVVTDALVSNVFKTRVEELEGLLRSKDRALTLLSEKNAALTREIDAFIAFNAPTPENDEDRPPHEVLISAMEEKGASLESLSEELDYGKSTLSRFLKGNMKMTPVLAVKLEIIGYCTAEFWMDLQTKASLKEARAELLPPLV